MLKILKPTMLVQVFEQAKWQEESINAVAKWIRFLQKSNPVYNFGKTTGNSYAKPFIQSKNEIMANTKQPETLLDKEEE